MILKKWILGVFISGACAAACATSSADRCSADTDCKGSRVCSDGVCVDPSQSGPDAGGGQPEAGSEASNPGSECDPVGTTCTATANCCQTGSGLGAEGAICISNDNLCHAACSTDAECQSGCCALVEGQSLGVCAAASNCAPTCVAPGGVCNVPADCCQTGANIPYGATCLSEDYTCHDICYGSSECASGCCIELNGLSYGACGTAAGHVCM
ncbi:MAG TPA: hypothetical protein VGH28_21555 [Polyangiaceae bacterium]